MKINFDRSACQGHNRCSLLAPELFGSDEEGYAVLLGGRDVPAELESAARRAADNCPEYAISIDTE